MNEIALFAGAGGGILGGILLGWRTVCAVELDDYCRKVLHQRQADGCLDEFPIWPDVRTFDGREWRGRVDVVSAGFPCQPFSVAGKQRGEDDERNLWPETIRVIREVGPRFALLENVPGLLAHPYFGTILGELSEAGFDAEWLVLGADDCGAPHRRKRLWILAHADRGRRKGERGGGLLDRERAAQWDDADGCDLPLADAPEPRLEGRREGLPGQSGSSWWSVEPDVGRVAHGIPDRVAQLRAAGNAQVPIVAAVAFRELVRRLT